MVSLTKFVKDGVKSTGNGLKMSLISITDSAAAEIKKIMGNANSEIEGLKISSSHRGCGQSFKMSLIEKGTSDIKSMECVSQKGVKIYLDNKVLLSIIGTELDYKEDRISSQFIFKNSNIDSVCGCGATFVPKK